MSRLSTRSPGWVTAGSAALLVLSLYGVTQIHVETDFQRRLHPENRVRLDHEYFQEQFCGTTALEIYVELPSRDSLHDPVLLGKVRSFQDAVGRMERVDGVVSLLRGAAGYRPVHAVL